MTTIMLATVLVDRQSLSMRNLAIAGGLVIAIEPEALLDASFQLSFAAVAALVAVFEAARRLRRAPPRGDFGRAPSAITSAWKERLALLRERLAHGPATLIFATFCATTATASFMAYDFHEPSPYVLIGSPLTLMIIEVFAVPGALIGTLLYPLGLDGFALCRLRDWLRALGRAADRRLAGRDAPFHRLRAMGDRFSDLRRALGGADVVVTPLHAPPGCAAALVLDGDRLKETGAVLLTARGREWAMTTARAADEDRPWSPAPKHH